MSKLEIQECLFRHNPKIEVPNNVKHKDIYTFIQWFLQIPSSISIELNDPLLLYYFDIYNNKMEEHVNNGTGAGGSNTNLYGKKFEEKTNNEPILILFGEDIKYFESLSVWINN